MSCLTEELSIHGKDKLNSNVIWPTFRYPPNWHSYGGVHFLTKAKQLHYYSAYCTSMKPNFTGTRSPLGSALKSSEAMPVREYQCTPRSRQNTCLWSLPSSRACSPTLRCSKTKSSSQMESSLHKRSKPTLRSENRWSYEKNMPAKKSVGEIMYGSSGYNKHARCYFTSRPPVEPTKLIYAGQPPSDASSNHRFMALMQNIQEIEKAAKAGREGSRDYYFMPTITVSQIQGNVYKYNERELNAKKSDEVMANYMVENILDRVEYKISQLLRKQGNHGKALRSSYTQSEGSGRYVKTRQDNRQTPSVTCESSPARSLSTTSSRCHTAIQVENNKNDCGDSLPSGLPKAGEGWLAGARALRDLHVRLVLRQLRYIDRMNHALESVSLQDKYKKIIRNDTSK